MAHVGAPPTCWTIDGPRAALATASVAARVDLLAPRLGLTQVRVDGRELAASLLQVTLPDLPADEVASRLDFYERGGDLVATYGDARQPAARAIVYWRVQPAAAYRALAAVELQVSIQTSALDFDPALEAGSALPTADCLTLADTGQPRFVPLGWRDSNVAVVQRESGVGCFIARLDERLSYAEMVYPLDYVQTTFAREPSRPGPGEPNTVLRHRLFSQRLEKGVLLRARVLGAFLPRRSDQSDAAECWSTFAASEPALAT